VPTWSREKSWPVLVSRWPSVDRIGRRRLVNGQHRCRKGKMHDLKQVCSEVDPSSLNTPACSFRRSKGGTSAYYSCKQGGMRLVPFSGALCGRTIQSKLDAILVVSISDRVRRAF
jgi:hypothetical protein